MDKLKIIINYLIGTIFIFAGIIHFTNADFFSALVPASLSNYNVVINAVTEIFLITVGFLFFIPRFRVFVKWSTILLLVVTLPAAILQVVHPVVVETFGISRELVAIRVLVQVFMIILIWWANQPKSSNIVPNSQ